MWRCHYVGHWHDNVKLGMDQGYGMDTLGAIHIGRHHFSAKKKVEEIWWCTGETGHLVRNNELRNNEHISWGQNMCKMGQFGWHCAGLAALCNRQVPNGSIFLYLHFPGLGTFRWNIFVTYFFGISWCVRGQHIRGGGNYNVIYE